MVEKSFFVEVCLRIAGYNNNDVIGGAIIGKPEIISNLLSNVQSHLWTMSSAILMRGIEYMRLFGNVYVLLIPVLDKMINYWMQIIGTGLTTNLGDFTHFSTKFNTFPTTYKRD